MNSSSSAWPEEARVLVRTKWVEGHSASQIARLLWTELRISKSRNAVIGIAFRTGLTGQNSHAPSRREPSAPRARAPSAPRAIVREPSQRAPGVAAVRRTKLTAAPVLVLVEKDGRFWPVPATATPTLELAASQCKFPVGEGTGTEQLHCGDDRPDDDDAYCVSHRRITGGRKGPKAVMPASLPRWARS